MNQMLNFQIECGSIRMKMVRKYNVALMFQSNCVYLERCREGRGGCIKS